MSKKSKSKTWADVEEGDDVELNGRTWTVVKIKEKGKRAKVTVERKGVRASSEVRLKDAVRIVGRTPLFDGDGRANRWATDAEARKAEAESAPARLEAGDPSVTKAPAKPKGGEWDKPVGKAEKAVTSLLGARLVGEATDPNRGYYVPPVNVTTVAAHLALFHGGIPSACDDDEGKMLAAHDAQHAAAKRGEGILSVNHWHEARRP